MEFLVCVCGAQEYGGRMEMIPLHKYYRDMADTIESSCIVSGLGMEILYKGRTVFETSVPNLTTYLSIMLAIRQRSGDVVRIGET